jgi:hypothetical protein
MDIKYINIFQSKALKKLPKLGFGFENKPSGNLAQTIGRWNANLSFENLWREMKYEKLIALPGLPDYSWNNIPKRGKFYQITTKCTKWSKNFKNRLNVNKIHQQLPLQDLPKFTQITIFGLKINYLSTLCSTQS